MYKNICLIEIINIVKTSPFVLANCFYKTMGFRLYSLKMFILKAKKIIKMERIQELLWLENVRYQVLDR